MLRRPGFKDEGGIAARTGLWADDVGHTAYAEAESHPPLGMGSVVLPRKRFNLLCKATGEEPETAPACCALFPPGVQLRARDMAPRSLLDEQCLL